MSTLRLNTNNNVDAPAVEIHPQVLEIIDSNQLGKSVKLIRPEIELAAHKTNNIVANEKQSTIKVSIRLNLTGESRNEVASLSFFSDILELHTFEIIQFTKIKRWVLLYPAII